MELEKPAEADLQTANMNGFIRWLVSLYLDIQSNFMLQLAKMQIIYSKVQKYVDSSSVNNDPTAAGEDCILASLERPSNYRLYYIIAHLSFLC